jgi:hypothetical protein
VQSYIRMADAGCGSGFPQEAAPGRFVPDELRTNDLESNWAPEVSIDGFVGDSHATASELHGCSIFVFENLIVLKTELRRSIRD